jgi:hypothetical protein
MNGMSDRLNTLADQVADFLDLAHRARALLLDKIGLDFCKLGHRLDTGGRAHGSKCRPRILFGMVKDLTIERSRIACRLGAHIL